MRVKAALSEQFPPTSPTNDNLRTISFTGTNTEYSNTSDQSNELLATVDPIILTTNGNKATAELVTNAHKLLEKQRSKALLRKSLKKNSENNRRGSMYIEDGETNRPRCSSNPGDSPSKAMNRRNSMLDPEVIAATMKSIQHDMISPVKSLHEKLLLSPLLSTNSPFRITSPTPTPKMNTLSSPIANGTPTLSEETEIEDSASKTSQKYGLTKSTTSMIEKLETLPHLPINLPNLPNLPNVPIFNLQKKVEENSGMTSYLKPIFEAIKPIIQKHVEMKPILFEKVSEFDVNPNLYQLISHFTSLFEAYEDFSSVWEGRKFLLRDALVPIVGRKKQSELVHLAQKFEEVHMISLEKFLDEMSTRAVRIYTVLSEFKTLSSTFETGYKELETLCSSLEYLQEKIITRLKKKQSQKDLNHQTLPKNEGSRRRIASERAINKFISSPRIDKKVILV